jgi:predicted O-methyltransferase YrrM
MTALTTAPIAPILERLEAGNLATRQDLEAELGRLDPAERARLFASAQSDYRGFYGRVATAHLAVSPTTGRLLYLLARSMRATSVVEFGTSFGVSTLYLAAALVDGGGAGRIISSEFEPAKVAAARESFAAAGVGHLVEVREGDALATLARDLPASIDLVLLDGAKVLYPRILALLEPRLREGALVVADNAADSPELLARVRAGDGYLSVPFGDDVEVAVRTRG